MISITKYINEATILEINEPQILPDGRPNPKYSTNNKSWLGRKWDKTKGTMGNVGKGAIEFTNDVTSAFSPAISAWTRNSRTVGPLAQKFYIAQTMGNIGKMFTG